MSRTSWSVALIAGFLAILSLSATTRIYSRFARHRSRALMVVLGTLALGSMMVLDARPVQAAIFNVEDPASVGDENPGDGICRSKLRPGTILRRCTLNAAVEEANALSGAHTIVVPAGTFRFDDNDCFALCGFMNVTSRITILGAGASQTTIKSIALFGHGILVHRNAQLTLRNLTYQDNSRIENAGGTLTISNSILRDNRSAFGGAISLRPGVGSDPGPTTIVNSRLTGNKTLGTGASGAIYAEGGNLRIESSTIDGNVANCSGCAGALHLARGSGLADLRNVTVSGNSEEGGGAGGIFVGAAYVAELRHVTIANNSTGGLFKEFGAGRIALRQGNLLTGNGTANCINSPTSIEDVMIQNLDSGTTCQFDSSNLSNIDPRIGPLQDNGGPTPTHALLSGSVAIDAADCILLTDQRGVTRPLDGNNDKQVRCDIGAFERPNPVSFVLPPLGVGAVSPSRGTAGVGQTYPFTYTWDVPPPTNWGAVGSLDLRLVNSGQLAFWLRWDQLLDTFQVLDAAGNPIGFSVPGGLDFPLTSRLITLDTASARAAGSGITGQRSTLTLPLQFADAAAGRVFQIEVSARNDEGQPEPFVAVGSIAVVGRVSASPSVGAPPIDPTVISANNDDEPKDAPPRLTQEQRQQRQRTNRGGHDDEHTEGQIIATRCQQDPSEVDIASRDGTITLLLRRDAVAACKSIKPGDYVEADGEKVHEQRYWIDDLNIHDR